MQVTSRAQGQLQPRREGGCMSKRIKEWRAEHALVLILAAAIVVFIVVSVHMLRSL